MLAKKIRTEYMKKFREPKWETFSKCYEDCVRYRVTRRVLEHAHRPWLWEGWDSGSDSSGRSTPTTRNKVSPLAVTSPTLYHSKNERSSPEPKHICGTREIRRPLESGEAERDLRRASPPPEPVIENGPIESDEGPLDRARVNTGPSDETHTDEDGPANQASSPGDDEEERARTRAKHCRRRRRHRAPRSEPGHGDVPLTPPSRAKSQPPAAARSSRPPPGRSDGTERRVEAPTRTPPEKREPLPFHRTPVTSSSSSSSLHTQGHAPRAGAPTRRESDKPGGSTAGRRRARSADLEKTQRSELAVAPDDRWVTEYMRCFSARLR